MPTNNGIREDVVTAVVAWKLSDKTSDDDPNREQYRLIDSATWPELQEAMRRLGGVKIDERGFLIPGVARPDLPPLR